MLKSPSLRPLASLLQRPEQLRRRTLTGAVLEMEDCEEFVSKHCSSHRRLGVGVVGCLCWGETGSHTLFDAIFLRALVTRILLLPGDALSAVLVMVLEGRALRGFCAFCCGIS